MLVTRQKTHPKFCAWLRRSDTRYWLMVSASDTLAKWLKPRLLTPGRQRLLGFNSTSDLPSEETETDDCSLLAAPESRRWMD